MISRTTADSIANSAPALSATMRRPASAGPTARAMLIATLLSATASGSSSSPMASGVIAW